MKLSKEIAKFISGMAAMEVLNHSFLALCGILPMDVFGWVVTRAFNLMILGGWSIVLVASFYYAWLHKD